LTSGLARIQFGNPLSVVLVDLQPVAALLRSIARGRSDYHLELEEGLTLPARVIGTGGVVGRRRVCFLRILAAPVTCYCIGLEWHEVRT
jgi:hypothetical protein